MKQINRRQALGTIAAGAVISSSLLSTGCSNNKETSMSTEVKTYENDYFYTDGKFDAVKAKEVYYDMFRRFNYPIPPRLKGDDFWTLDFNLGIFTEIGMAGIFWVNHLEMNHVGHEIYLLPGQMIPEHAHLATDKAGPKVESWHVRHGWIYVAGIGKESPDANTIIPPSHRDIAKARDIKKLMPGETASLTAATDKHFMIAGPEGAIVSEYSTFHDGNGLRFTHPKAGL